MVESLEHAAFRLFDNYFKQQEENILAGMSDVFRLVFPKASDQDIQKAVSKFTSKAIALKIEMTKVAAYHCFWVNGGKQFNSENMEIADDEFGPVYFCTFPGLARTIKVKEQKNAEQVSKEVKATVVLRSAFGEDENEHNLSGEIVDNISDRNKDDVSGENEDSFSDDDEDNLSDANEDNLFDENEDNLSVESADNLPVENLNL